MADIVSLNFQIDGNNNENEVFTIEISNDKKVDALKPIVKKRFAPLFDTIPSTQIKLSLTPNDEYRNLGFSFGIASLLADFAEELQEQKIRSFSSYKTLEELKDVPRKYKVNGEEITSIKQFNPVFEEIDDDDKALDQCMNEITLRLSNLETMQTNANEATRCVFITSILNASLAIVRRLTNEEKIYMSYQKNISGEEASGRVDYAIKGNEDLMCIAEGKPRNVEIGYLQNIMQLESAYQTNKKKRTADQAFRDDDYDYLYGIVSTATEWHFIMFTTDGLYCTSKSEYPINLSKMALKEDLDSIRKGVRRVLGVIVGLLKDRISVDNSPARESIVQDIEIPEIPKCSICTKDILSIAYKAFTTLECGHVFHRVCIEKKIMHTTPSICPSPNCGKSVDVVDEGSRRDSTSSQISGTSTLVDEFNTNLGFNSPRTSSQGQAMDVDENEETEHRHEPTEDQVEESSDSTSKKRANEATDKSTEKPSDKKAKKVTKAEDSIVLKRLIRELSFDTTRISEIREKKGLHRQSAQE
ncbi:17438_t:CDS:2, partial [Racocetra persica]